MAVRATTADFPAKRVSVSASKAVTVTILAVGALMNRFLAPAVVMVTTSACAASTTVPLAVFVTVQVFAFGTLMRSDNWPTALTVTVDRSLHTVL